MNYMNAPDEEGQNWQQDCQSRKGDPSQLDNGLVIQQGQPVSVAFDTVGTYQITSKTTSHMNITIDVSPPPDINSGV